ncbi:hypothetical protein Q4530_15595 [Colwellia sp. 1_MG-2023]|uniref:hypothetical protein n=1 Tax=unclassified Colwellia TaxID=196834 RepID=UPI001C0803C8|nr:MULTISPECIES: hypothetical protein [unclassified Colwellia]MBU2924673.1 hypothetical protein [Colwellia sp. C2M11]MDO6653929.1 hypothetical protein [Colwellia sp. 3_MG-2023]MDO6666756.1 hypothetical protein [Colwellia sp. 2_MG-2023]MDO6691197.1 hypothetical protein [Colwellia sp. 1_MG-2023]
MKSINIYKLAIVATSAVMVYFASGLASIAQASDLIKAEPIKQESLINQAQANLAVTFSTITITPSTIQDNASEMIAKERVVVNQSEVITLSKNNIMSE